MLRISLQDSKPTTDFRHEALLYEGLEDFVARTVPYIREGVEAGEPIAVTVVPEKVTALREALGADRNQVDFLDVAEVSRNPARIIPAWRRFSAERRIPGRGIRGLGEPIWKGRSEDEIVECQLHEALINFAFSDVEGARLLCPYDAGALDPAIIHEARCTHSHLHADGEESVSREYRGPSDLSGPFAAPLPPPPSRPDVLSFDQRTLPDVRDLVSRTAAAAGLGRARGSDLMLAVHELATNSVRHGGGNGVLRIWREDGDVVCEIKDRGHITDPLAGRHVPAPTATGGRGLWIANQLCDLVQIRSGAATGTVVRLRMRAASPAPPPGASAAPARLSRTRLR